MNYQLSTKKDDLPVAKKINVSEKMLHEGPYVWDMELNSGELFNQLLHIHTVGSKTEQNYRASFQNF